MSTATLRQLFEAGVHFGHRTCFREPKMAPYIYGVRNGISIVDLEKTRVILLKRSIMWLKSLRDRVVRFYS